jgi:hypothetical protein
MTGAPPEGAQTDRARVTVTIDDDHLAVLDSVVAELSRRGMEVDQVLGAVGMVTGLAPDRAALAGVAGVLSVDLVLGVQLPDPEGEVQ